LTRELTLADVQSTMVVSCSSTTSRTFLAVGYDMIRKKGLTWTLSNRIRSWEKNVKKKKLKQTPVLT